MATIAADAIAAGNWPQLQPVRRRPKSLRFGSQTTESDWLTLRLNERQVRDFVIEVRYLVIAKLDRLTFAQRIAQLKTERFVNPNFPLIPNLGVRINDFA